MRCWVNAVLKVEKLKGATPAANQSLGDFSEYFFLTFLNSKPYSDAGLKPCWRWRSWAATPAANQSLGDFGHHHSQQFNTQYTLSGLQWYQVSSGGCLYRSTQTCPSRIINRLIDAPSESSQKQYNNAIRGNVEIPPNTVKPSPLCSHIPFNWLIPNPVGSH